ncbi:glycosyltransferase [Devosia sp. MC532]|uniref:glycosyltransferase family 2 protein n=1 Tax=Devosia sp. MC532 TaxID=2799788 RepID=UPI0018F56471|nr:glycosyltransferase family 2 protein [Devosia sp. MC532]MBJ7579093.1 glycosyltransferase [Devosia sp. MC532]
MSVALELMAALIGTKQTHYTPKAALEAALMTEVDPMHWCAVHLDIAPAEIMSRAAHWVGLAFFDVVPRVAHVVHDQPRVEMFASLRMVRFKMLDREFGVAAPDFFAFLHLARVVEADPGIKGQLLIVPSAALRDALVGMHEEHLLDDARQRLTRKWPYAAAQLDLTRKIREGVVITVTILVLALTIAPWTGIVWALPVWLWLIILPSCIRLAAIFTPIPHGVTAEPILGPDDLPIYTVMVPLRDEAGMVDQLCANLLRLDYPREKLQIMFLVESRSPETVDAVRKYLGDARFSLIVVPDAAPRTKPKALDFGLPFCTGEYVVVYDAEDRPDPDQLRRVVAQFRRQTDVVCIQARLVISNGNGRFLPSLFAGDYAGLFAVLLPAFAKWNMVMPLGGTSNHFRMNVLREIGGWDPYNVTEDADLGVRLARRGLLTATSNSRTFEDAPTSFRPWLGQRTRWLKGWIQTFVVHNRRPNLLLRDLGLVRMLIFEAVLLGMLISPLLHLTFVMAVFALLISGQGAAPLGEGWFFACVVVLVLGQAVAVGTNILGLWRTGQMQLMLPQLLLPFYWLLVGLATIFAFLEFAQKPFHWFKTPHLASKRRTKRSR